MKIELNKLRVAGVRDDRSDNLEWNGSVSSISFSDSIGVNLWGTVFGNNKEYKKIEISTDKGYTIEFLVPKEEVENE